MKKIYTILWAILVGFFINVSAWADGMWTITTSEIIEDLDKGFFGLYIFLLLYLFLAFISFWLLAPFYWKNKKRLLAISLIAPVIFYAGIFLINVIGKIFHDYYGVGSIIRKLSILFSLSALFLLGTIFSYRHVVAKDFPEKNKIKLTLKLICPCILKMVAFFALILITNYYRFHINDLFLVLVFLVAFPVLLLLIDILSVLFVFHKKWSYLVIQLISFCLSVFYVWFFAGIIGYAIEGIVDVYISEFPLVALLLLFPMIDMIFIRGVFHKSWKYYAAHISIYTLLFVLYISPFYLILSLIDFY